MSPILTDQPFVRATVTSFFFGASLNAFVLLPLYIQQLGGREVQIGVVMGLYSAVGIVCQPLIGPWVDAGGRRPFMLAGVALALAAAGVVAAATAISHLAAARALQGLAFSAFFVASFAYVIDMTAPARRGWALGIYGVSGLISTALAPLVGEWVVRRFGFRPLFGMSAILAVIALVLTWSLRDPPRERAGATRGPSWARLGQDLRQRYNVVALFFGLGTGTIFAFVPTFAESLGVASVALFFTAYAGAAIAVRVFGGGLIDALGRRAVIVPSMFTQAAASAVLASLGLFAQGRTPRLPFLFLSGLMSGGAHGFLYPALAALVADQAPAVRRGAVIGIFSGVFLFGNAAGAFTFGAVAHGGGYGLMWAVLGTALLAGAFLSRGLPGPRRAAPTAI
ncbi:MAG: MFS transporter [Candidatus Rokubacteria bacterium]|nr:MFS transporter [Candidatus Rokubacteria bacterium]MBI3825337.1 MFS transporter [Candidatus Rokubacteria bacterium]